MAKFHSSKSTKPLVPEDETKPTTPDLTKPVKKSVTVAHPTDEVHWITKPSSAMEKVDEPVASKKDKSADKELDAALLAQPVSGPAFEKSKDDVEDKASEKSTAKPDAQVDKSASTSKWMEDQPEPSPIVKEAHKEKPDAKKEAVVGAAAVAATSNASSSKSKLPKEFQIDTDDTNTTSSTTEDTKSEDAKPEDLKPVVVAEAVTPVTPTAPIETIVDPSGSPTWKSKKVAVGVIIAILLLIGVSVGGWYVLGRSDTDTDSQSTASSSQSETDTNVAPESATPTPSPEPSPEVTPTPEPSATPTSTPEPTVTPTSSTAVEALWLTASKSSSTAQLSWKLEGNAPQGLNVMWSTSDNPTVPARAGDHVAHVGPDARSYTVTGLQAGQTYYFRVGVSNATGGTRWYSNSSAITF